MFLWILVLGGMFSFFASMGIGANDAANAFASSIGSKSLTIKQAVILACIFESSGAILMGSHVVNTVRKGIADYECFIDEPYVFMWMYVGLSLSRYLALLSIKIRDACFNYPFLYRRNDRDGFCSKGPSMCYLV